mgnify:CR=1 FL=1
MRQRRDPPRPTTPRQSKSTVPRRSKRACWRRFPSTSRCGVPAGEGRASAPHDAPTVKGRRSPVPPPTDTAVHNPPCARYSCTGYSCTPANACPHSPEAPWLVSSVPFYNATGPPQSGGACPSQPSSVHAGSRLLHRTLPLHADTSHCPQCLVWGNDAPLHATPTLLPPCGLLARPLHGQCRLRHQAPGALDSGPTPT